jgi:hypothetical protein
MPMTPASPSDNSRPYSCRAISWNSLAVLGSDPLPCSDIMKIRSGDR